MPTYEYECKSCGHTFEAFQPMTAKPLSKCPKCQKSIRRLIGVGAGIIFKGAGFYETDYKKKASPSTSTACKNDSSENTGAKKKVSSTSSQGSDCACRAAAGTCSEN